MSTWRAVAKSGRSVRNGPLSLKFLSRMLAPPFVPTQLPHFAIGRQVGITQCGVTLENLKALFFGGANWAQRNTSDHETMDLILDQFRHAQHTTAQRSTGNTTANCSTRDCAAETRM